eukprot:1225695-Prymnesium_polylepis.1
MCSTRTAPRPSTAAGCGPSTCAPRRVGRVAPLSLGEPCARARRGRPNSRAAAQPLGSAAAPAARQPHTAEHHRCRHRRPHTRCIPPSTTAARIAGRTL